MYGTEPVGSACLVADRRTAEWLLVTARHCLGPQPGQPIGDLGLMAYGYKLRHIASFPGHDISVLAFEGSPHLDASLQKAGLVVPFKLASSTGLVRGWQVTAAGFPLVVEKDLPGAASCEDGVLSSGVISLLELNMDLALGDYGGAMPNSSGGAVVLSEGPEGRLVGVHLGTVWHQEGQPPADDDVWRQGDQPAEGVWGEGRLRDLMETERWSEAPHMALLSTGVKQRRASANASTDQGQGRSRVSIEAVIQYCLENVEHKGFLSCFVPAHTLGRLLQLALSGHGTAAGGGPAGQASQAGRGQA